ncbi:class I SAM-dependent methyltransferase [Hydrogeniiclostridium mannosilyticum]|uniref:class I SAM-dependent methyltransferase n=1 Tax=Hydrogeniiclostridium mannosilyticum TaxID=2764322 RepID=UPI0018AA190B|nr:methyltransferase domain-containing protein [Hydrogeniiclostridium mannosilyticum]
MKNNNDYKNKVRDVYNEIANHYLDNFSKGRLRLLFDLIQDSIKVHITEEIEHVLDAGGGMGHFGMVAAERGALVTVIDIAKSMLDVGRELSLKNGLNNKMIYKEGDVEKLEIQDNTFDFIISEGSVLSFLSNPQQALNEFYRVLRPKGKALLSVQNRMYFMYESHSLPVIQAVYKSGRVFPQINSSSDYRCTTHSFMPEEIRSMIKQSGFDILYFRPRFIVASRFEDIDMKLDSDPSFYQEMLLFEKKLECNPEFINLGRMFSILIEKPGKTKPRKVDK